MDITPDPRAAEDGHTSRSGGAEIIPFPGANTSRAPRRDRDQARGNTAGRSSERDGERSPRSSATHLPEFRPSGPPIQESLTEAAPLAGAETLTGAEALHDAETLVVRSLSRSAKSEQEVRSLLREQTELSLDDQEVVVERMKAQHYVDDAQLAEDLCSGKLSRKGLGSNGMAQELRKRGIPDEFIRSQLDQIEPDDELARATELAVERLRRLRGVEDEAAYRRLHGFLARRGYRADVIRHAIRDAQGR